MVDGTVSVESPGDPLADLLFLPETLGGTSAISDRMYSIHTCFKSLALSNPQKLLEQAKTIVDNGSGLLNVKIPSPIASEEKYEAVPVLMDVKSPSSIAPKAKYGAIPVHINLRTHRPVEKITAGPVQAHQNLHEQRAREGLGRKRARFSLKPNSSQPFVSLESSLDIDKLQDPAEFFLAYERIENAKKELQKQNGAISMDSGQVNSFRATRQRRPGLLGRSASFRHGNSSIAAHEDGSFISSQETFQPDIHSQQPTDIDIALLENEFPDSAAKGKKNAHNLVDELLFKKCEGLEGDGVVNFVKEVLQMKPIDVAKVKSPLHDVQRNECTVLEGYLPMPRNPLFHLKNVISRLSNRKTVKCKNVGDTIVDIPASSTSPKSPSVSSDSTPMRYSPIRRIHDQPDWINTKKELSVSGNLKRLIDEEGDTRSANSGDTSQHGITNVSSGSQSKPGNDMDDYKMKDLYTDNSSVRPENDVEENWYSETYNLRNEMQNGFINDMVVDSNSSRPEADSDVFQNEHTEWHDPGNHVGSDYVSVMAMDCHTMKLHSDVQINECSLSPDPQDEMMDTDSNRLKADSNVHKIENSELCDSVEGLVGGYRKDMFVDNASRPEIDSDAQTNEHSKSHEKVEGMPHDTAVSALSVENLNDNCTLSSQLSPAVEPSTANGPSKTADINTGQSIQKIQEPVVEQKKGKNPTHRKRKVPMRECQEPMLQLEAPKEQKKGRQPPRKREVSGRKSLQGAGMLWQSGVRRSTRIKSRPLEYWKGERFLYGRVHQSLTTVIGLKYVSPSKGKGEPTLRVKSYVSDEYKELVELAALH